MALELHLYDFDGTLFRAPDRPPWWGRSTWIMESVSLGPPCVPQKPGGDWWISSAVGDAKRSIGNPDVWAILCTGRALGSSHRYRVPELLKQKGLNFDEVYLNPGSDTKTYKIKVILKLLQRFPDITTVHIWENHLSNMAAFCKAVERAGRICVEHPIKVPGHEPICEEQELIEMDEQGWIKRRASIQRVAYHHLMGLRIEQRKGEFPTEFWRQVVLSLCKKMGVNHSKLKVQFRKRLSDPNANADYHFSGVLRIKPPARISPVALKQLFESMAHELQHAKQEQTGQYQNFQRNEAGERGSTWEGTFYPEDSPYWDRPWEVDARKAGERYGPPLYQEMKSKGMIPLSKQEKWQSKEPFEGPTVGDWGVLTDEEQDEDIRLRKTSFKVWLEKWRERYKTGWRGLKISPEVGRVADAYMKQSGTLDVGAEYLSSVQRVAARWRQTRSKTACIIAAGNWGGHKCLFKSRDRRYNPKVSIYHEIQNGVEVLYMKDEFTGWCEGLNEHHVGVVNTALDVIHDENEKDIILKDTLGHTPRNGKRILKALTKKTAKAAADSIKTFDGGLKGHTFVADLSDTLSLEATEDHEYHERQLSTDQKHVRTNHGQKHQDAGYTEDDEENYLSSLARRDQAMKVLRGVDKPTGLAPAIYGKRKKDHSDPLNMVKLTDGMRTSTQMVMDLTDLTAHLYLLPKMVKFLGYKKDLPKDYKPKLTVKVYEYGKLDDKGEFKTKPKKLAGLSDAAGAEYLSAKLTPMAQAKLLRAFPALHSEVRGDHMTVWYDPPERILGELTPLIGKKVRLKVVGYAEDEKGQAVVIDTRLPNKNRVPHVTVSFAGGAKAVYSNRLLARGYEKVVGPTLDAVLTIDQ